MPTQQHPCWSHLKDGCGWIVNAVSAFLTWIRLQESILKPCHLHLNQRFARTDDHIVYCLFAKRINPFCFTRETMRPFSERMGEFVALQRLNSASFASLIVMPTKANS